MIKYVLIGIFLLAAGESAFCQNDESLKIDSLKKKLPLVNDTARIDCLNDISYYYTLLSEKISATGFASRAHEEAKRLNYIHGIAESISRKAGIAQHFENNFLREEGLARESLQWYDKTGKSMNVTKKQVTNMEWGRQ